MLSALLNTSQGLGKAALATTATKSKVNSITESSEGSALILRNGLVCSECQHPWSPQGSPQVLQVHAALMRKQHFAHSLENNQVDVIAALVACGCRHKLARAYEACVVNWH